MPDPKYFSQVEMQDGTLLEVKDKVAREAIAGGVSYIGKLWIGSGSGHMTDGDTRTSVEIVDPTAQTGHKTVTAQPGYLLIDEGESGNPSNEYIYDGTSWQEFGNESLADLGSFAFVDEGRVTVPTVSYGNPTPNSTSTAATVTIAENASGNLAITGTFTNPSFSATPTLTGSGTISTGTQDYKVISSSVPTGQTKSYTPEGSVTAPTISLNAAGSTTTIKNPTSKTVVTGVTASAPSATAASGEMTYMSYDETTETLSFKKIAVSTGASISTSNVTVKNGDPTYTASAPTFTGTDTYLYADDVQTITSTTVNVTTTGTVSGTTTGGAYTPKKYQVGVTYDKTTSVTQGTKTDGTVTKVVTPYTGT